MQPLRLITKNNIAIPKSKHFITFGSRETCPVRDEPWFTWLANNGVEFIDLPNGRIYDYYVEEKGFHRALERLRQKMSRNWLSHTRNYRKKKQLLTSASRDLSLSAKSGDKVRIRRSYEAYFQAAYDFNEYIWGAWAVIYRVEPDLMKQGDMDIGSITKLDRPITFMKMQRNVFRLPLKNWLNRYQWLNLYNPYDREYTTKDFWLFRKTINRKDLEKQYDELKRARGEFKRLVSCIRSKSMKQNVLMTHTYAWLKTDRIDAWRQSMFELRGFYSFLASFVDVRLREACNLSHFEIIQLLHGRKGQVNVSELKKRSANKALYRAINNKLEAIYQQRSVRSIYRRLTAHKIVSELNGLCACQGQAVGPVRIVGHSSDLSRVKSGDIFVAKYTFPTYLPAMAKCAAIVADDGGLTSHAAIVSRELEIPCVVGTKIATKVLKDGDRVEVDATKGVVRKIS